MNDLFKHINTNCKIKPLENTDALITSIEIYGGTNFDIWYVCSWFIDGKPVSEKFLEKELIFSDFDKKNEENGI